MHHPAQRSAYRNGWKDCEYQLDPYDIALEMVGLYLDIGKEDKGLDGLRVWLSQGRKK